MATKYALPSHNAPTPSQPRQQQKMSWQRLVFLIALFVVIVVIVRVVIRPINNVDYNERQLALDAFWHGKSPYIVEGYYEPPWAIFFLLPLTNQPIETGLALTCGIFVVGVIAFGKPSGLLQMAHPIFILLWASSNPEWLYIGTGLCLLYGARKGWGRGLAWLLLTCKPQTSAILLIFDGWDAIRQRDWKAILLSSVVAITMLLIYPDWFHQIRLRMDVDWSMSVIYHYTIVGAVLVTVLILILRRKRLRDRKTLGLLLAPVWTPFMLEYSFTAILFTMRSAGWKRNLFYLLAGIGLAFLFWQNYHTTEQIGGLGMLLLAAWLAPDYSEENPGGEGSAGAITSASAVTPDVTTIEPDTSAHPAISSGAG